MTRQSPGIDIETAASRETDQNGQSLAGVEILRVRLLREREASDEHCYEEYHNGHYELPFGSGLDQPQSNNPQLPNEPVFAKQNVATCWERNQQNSVVGLAWS
jgi:hypothetical protein